MENNDNDMRSIHEYVEEQVHVEAPVVETPAEPAEEPVKVVNSEVNLSGKVALYSTKSVRWEEVGTLNRGYNIVTQKQADKWLTRSHVRVATPEEVQKAFG